MEGKNNTRSFRNNLTPFLLVGRYIFSGKIHLFFLQVRTQKYKKRLKYVSQIQNTAKGVSSRK